MNLADTDGNRLPRRLYHYTGQEGLLGILRDRVLFATDIRFVNDRTEYQHALDIAKRQASGSIPAGDQVVFNAIAAALDDIESYGTGAVYITSFSTKGDDLNQWRAYSAGGAGFCIGFDPKALCESVGPSWQLAKCIYGDNEKDSFVADVVNALLDERRVREWPLDESYIEHKLADSFLERLAPIAPILKDSAFHSENEWRLWAPRVSDELSWRTAKYVPTPYLRIPLGSADRLPIRSITIGPTADTYLARLSIESLLDSVCGSKHGIEVVVSNVPYRA